MKSDKIGLNQEFSVENSMKQVKMGVIQRNGIKQEEMGVIW